MHSCPRKDTHGAPEGVNCQVQAGKAQPLPLTQQQGCRSMCSLHMLYPCCQKDPSQTDKTNDVYDYDSDDEALAYELDDDNDEDDVASQTETTLSHMLGDIQCCVIGLEAALAFSDLRTLVLPLAP